MNRQHQHNLNGDRPVWVDCLTLDHCPSVCDCRPADPCARVVRPPSAAGHRRWHIAYVNALGHRLAAITSDRDHDHMREMRAAGASPDEAAAATYDRLLARHGTGIAKWRVVSQ